MHWAMWCASTVVEARAYIGAAAVVEERVAALEAENQVLRKQNSK